MNYYNLLLLILKIYLAVLLKATLFIFYSMGFFFDQSKIIFNFKMSSPKFGAVL